MRSTQWYLGAALTAFKKLKNLLFVLNKGLYDGEDDFKEVVDAKAEWEDDCWLFPWDRPTISPFSAKKAVYLSLNIPTIQIQLSIEGVRLQMENKI